jgi:hypothetical protein
MARPNNVTEHYCTATSHALDTSNKACHTSADCTPQKQTKCSHACLHEMFVLEEPFKLVVAHENNV